MRILVVDDHPLIVDALEQSLPQVDPRLAVVGAANREQTLTALARHPDTALVLLDLALPGARGFIAKTAHPRLLIDAIRTVLAGGEHFTRDIAPTRVSMIDGVPIDVLGLTQRQSEVMLLLAQGKPNKLICRDLRLSEGTVKVHVSAILKALNVHSRSQVIVELARRGISPEWRAPRS